MRKFILWDHDGVLVDTEYWFFKSNQRALSEAGIALNKNTYRQFMIEGKSCWDLASDIGMSVSDIEHHRNNREVYYQEYLVSEDIEIPGVLDALEILSKTHRMAIVTTSKRCHFDLIHKNRSIVPFMEFIITREDYALSKPNPEPYLLGLKMLGAKAQSTLIVEDSQRGLQSAIAAGIDCAIVDNQFTRNHDFTGAKYRLKSLNELAPLLNH